LCNGTQLIVSKIGDKVVEAKVIAVSIVEEIALIPRINLTLSNLSDLQLRRRQFHLKLAFVMTISKCLGQALNSIGVYLLRPVFSHGKLCVALSHVSHLSRLTVLLFNKIYV